MDAKTSSVFEIACNSDLGLTPIEHIAHILNKDNMPLLHKKRFI